MVQPFVPQAPPVGLNRVDGLVHLRLACCGPRDFRSGLAEALVDFRPLLSQVPDFPGDFPLPLAEAFELAGEGLESVVGAYQLLFQFLHLPVHAGQLLLTGLHRPIQVLEPFLQQQQVSAGRFEPAVQLSNLSLQGEVSALVSAAAGNELPSKHLALRRQHRQLRMGLSDLQGCLIAGGNEAVEQMGEGGAKPLAMAGRHTDQAAHRNEPRVSSHQILDQDVKGVGGRVGGAVACDQKGGSAGAALAQQIDAFPRIGRRIDQEKFELLTHKLFHGPLVLGVHLHQIGQDPVGPKFGPPGPVGHRQECPHRFGTVGMVRSQFLQGLEPLILRTELFPLLGHLLPGSNQLLPFPVDFNRECFDPAGQLTQPRFLPGVPAAGTFAGVRQVPAISGCLFAFVFQANGLQAQLVFVFLQLVDGATKGGRSTQQFQLFRPQPVSRDFQFAQLVLP